jgi:GxxExxY protein
MDTDRINLLTEQIIGCAYRVSNELGCGFLEKVYENAMVVALKKSGLKVEQQVRFEVRFDSIAVGEYIADLVVEHAVIVEIKAVKSLDEVHEAQCINQLRVTNLPVCLLMNFAKPKLDIKRFAGRSRMQI